MRQQRQCDHHSLQCFKRRIAAILLILTLPPLLTQVAVAQRFQLVAGTQMPVSRLLKNIGNYVKKHPSDSMGYHTLAHVQGAAFALNVDELTVYTHRPLPEIDENIEARRHAEQPLTTRDVMLLGDSIRNYRKASGLDANDGMAWFGLGFECEEALRFPECVDSLRDELGLLQPSAKDPASMNEALRALSLGAYRKALAILAPDGQIPIATDGFGEEAANGIVRLQSAKLLHGQNLTVEERAELITLEVKIKQLRFISRVALGPM